MANQTIHQPKDYSEVLRRLEITDPNHANTFNPLFERLVNNDAFIREFIESLAVDIFSSSFVVSGMQATKEGFTVNVSAGICYVLQPNGGLRRWTPSAKSFVTEQASTTYFLDFQPDGSYHWDTAHSTQENYLAVASAETNASGSVAVVNDERTVKDTNVAAILDAVQAQLESTMDGNSGADYVKMTPIAETGSANSVQAVLETLINRLKSSSTGSSGADLIGASSIPGLSGSTTQALVRSLKEFMDAHLADETNRHKASNISVADTGNHFTATNVEGALEELFTSVSDGKTHVAAAITDKGVPASGSDTFSQLADKIGDINTGVTPAGTAVVGDVLAGKTFINSTGATLTGTMPNRGAVNITPGTTNQAIQAGYHNGSGVVAGSANLIAENIKSGVNIFGVVGTGKYQLGPNGKKVDGTGGRLLEGMTDSEYVDITCTTGTLIAVATYSVHNSSTSDADKISIELYIDGVLVHNVTGITIGHNYTPYASSTLLYAREVSVGVRRIELRIIRDATSKGEDPYLYMNSVAGQLITV